MFYFLTLSSTLSESRGKKEAKSIWRLKCLDYAKLLITPTVKVEVRKNYKCVGDNVSISIEDISLKYHAPYTVRHFSGNNKLATAYTKRKAIALYVYVP